MTEAQLDEWASGSDPYFVQSRAHVPPPSETTPVFRPGRLVVSAKFFEGGLRFPCSSFVGEVLDLFGLEIQHITVNTIIHLSICEWVFRMKGARSNMKAFAQREPPAPLR